MRHNYSISKSKRAKAMAKTSGLCWYCGAPATGLDHVVPRTRKHIQRVAPKHGIDNLLPACTPCNQRKGNRLMEEFRKSRAGTRFWGDRLLPATTCFSARAR